MLCGEFHKAPLGLYVNFASLSDSRSPYSSLLTLVQSMAALTAHAAHEEEDIFLGEGRRSSFCFTLTLSFPENGLLSYENPNYHLDPTRIDDALNSNTNIYEDIYQELDDICNIGHSIKEPLLGGPGRKAYAALDIGTMGVDITSGPLTHISSSNINDNKRYDDLQWNVLRARAFLQLIDGMDQNFFEHGLMLCLLSANVEYRCLSERTNRSRQ
jgi:hypothetical protein